MSKSRTATEVQVRELFRFVEIDRDDALVMQKKMIGDLTVGFNLRGDVIDSLSQSSMARRIEMQQEEIEKYRKALEKINDSDCMSCESDLVAEKALEGGKE